MWGESISDHGREVFLERTRNCLAALGSFTLATAQDVLRGGSWFDGRITYHFRTDYDLLLCPLWFEGHVELKCEGCD
jgi:hypothetical protein